MPNITPMSETSVLSGSRNGSSGGASARLSVGAPRTIARRRTLPSGRAFAGAFLIALAVVGIFAAWSGATRGPQTRFLVAARDLPIGTTIGPADLRSVGMELPESLAASSAFTAVSELDGVRVINPIREGELIQGSSLVVAGAAGGMEMSFAIERERAVGGRLKPGEHVDLIATFGTGADTETTTVIQRSRILDVAAGSDALGGSGPLTITISVPDGETARDVAHAVDAAKLTLVRSSPQQTAKEGGATAAASSTTPED